jgi:hypothetical protein
MRREGSDMEIAFDCSSVDYPLCVPDELGIPEDRREKWLAQVWGRGGLENIFDTILATGSSRVHFRSHCAGPWWPTTIHGAGPGAVGRPLEPSFEDWNLVAEAVEIGHEKGLKIIGWFDLTEGHAGIPTTWALNHPELCIVDRRGSRLDGPLRLVGHDGKRFDPSEGSAYRDLIEKGFMDEECERPDGTTIDPHLSLAYPEVVEYRLGLLDELLSFGVDGVYLTANSCVGYEEPVTESFIEQHAVSPWDVPEDDPRWVEHTRGYFTDFLRQVSRLMDRHRRRSGWELDLVLEGQGSEPRDQGPEPGWPMVPAWTSIPPFMDIESIAREGLVNGVSLWTFKEIDRLRPRLPPDIKIATRYRYSEEVFTRANLRTRMKEAEKRGVSLFVINEPRVPLLRFGWMYPGAPGPLYQLAGELAPTR